MLHAANATPSAASGAGDLALQPAVAGDELAPPAHARSTSMRFSVSVPVLSVQMTVVAPRVSTALRRFTSAPPRARRRTPTASASVIVGSSPSGTFATSSPIAKTTASSSDSPAASVPERDERRRGDHGDERDEPRDAADLDLQRAVVDAGAL